MATPNDSLADFVSSSFTHEKTSKDVFWKGQGPAVVVMCEIPGISPAVADFARRVVDAGFSVAMPDLFGTPGKAVSNGYIARSFTKACIAREFVALGTKKSSPITSWLLALAHHAHEKAGDARGKGVGAVGMCFTGGFGLAMAIDPLIMSPVLSQPSLPLGITKKQQSSVGMSSDDIRIVQDRATNEEDFCVMGLRFTGDPLVPAQRFQRYRELLGDSFLAVEIDSSSANQHEISKRAHSVLTEEYTEQHGHPVKAAHDQVIEHFKSALMP